MSTDATLWTIRLALCCYAAAVAMRLWALSRSPTEHFRWSVVFSNSTSSRDPDSGSSRSNVMTGMLWTAAWLLTSLHVGLAFAEHHQWSHAAAYAYTARETLTKVGLNWGGGLYFNYLLLLVWGLAVGRLWRLPRWFQSQPSTRTERFGFAAVECFIAFMAFNATVVFGRGPVQVVASLIFALFFAWCCLLFCRNKSRRNIPTGARRSK